MLLDPRPGDVAADAGPSADGESEADRSERLRDLATATLRLTVAGDVDATIAADLPCEVLEERSEGHDPLAWLVVRVESYEPLVLGSTTLTALSIAVPGHVGPGLYPLDDLRRRVDADEIGGWQVDDFHLSPSPMGDESTFYLGDPLVGAWVAVTGGSVAFDLPLVSVHSAVRATGSITWGPDDRPLALVQTTSDG